MGLSVVAVSAGSAHRALAQSVAQLKQGNPLRSVTVLVPTNAAGVMARRRLGRDGGVAAVDMITLYRLAERVGGPALRAEQRLPVSTAVIELAVRGVLRDERTMFEAVADHPSTAVAVRELYRQLRMVGPGAVAALERVSRRGRQVAQVIRSVEARLAGRWYDEADLLRHAASVVRSAASGSFHDIVVFLPQSLGPLDLQLLEALGALVDVRVLLGLTGDRQADRDLIEIAAGLGAAVAPPATIPAPRHPDVISLTDADEEARHAVSLVVDAARAGTPLASIAVVWPSDRPYARLVEHHLDRAGIPWNGRPGTLVAERLVPRFLLDLLDVDRRNLRRRDVFDLLADLPVRDAEGRPVPVAAWERASRDAGVVRDEHWRPRLRTYAGRQRHLGRDHTAEAAESLLAFVDQLRSDLGHPARRRSWSEWADWAADQIDRRVGIATLRSLDEAEYQAWEHTSRVLDRLRNLDAIGGPATRHEFRSVFAAEFDVAPGRLGRIGAGVTIGSLGGSAGFTADRVIVIGAAEGVMPSAPPIDPLLSEGERRAAGLPSSEAATDRALRQLLGVVHSDAALTVLYPRGDLRATTIRQPSRWLEAFAEAPRHHVASQTAGLLATRFPSTATIHRLRHLLATAVGHGPGAITGSGDPILSRALALRAARRTDALTIYDGDLSTLSIDHFGRPVSPTQLQQWPNCPHAYFVQYLLGVRAIEDPGDEIALTAMDRGNLIHDVLDRFHREVIDGALPQPGREGWVAIHRMRIAELLVAVSEQFERTGRAGRAAYWELDRARIVHEIDGWITADSIRSVSRGAEVLHSEVRFGRDGDVTIPLADGRRLAIQGAVDRIDRTATGLVVTDHKSGGSKPYEGLTHDQPTGGGTMFQLPAYAAAARALSGQQSAVVAEYAFFGRSDYKRIGYQFDDDVWGHVASDLQHVVDGIEAGWFPARAERPGFQRYASCLYCQPDSLGTAERFAEWDRKQHDPRISRWFGAPADGESDGAPGDAS